MFPKDVLNTFNCPQPCRWCTDKHNSFSKVALIITMPLVLLSAFFFVLGSIIMVGCSHGGETRLAVAMVTLGAQVAATIPSMFTSRFVPREVGTAYVEHGEAWRGHVKASRRRKRKKLPGCAFIVMVMLPEGCTIKFGKRRLGADEGLEKALYSTAKDSSRVL